MNKCQCCGTNLVFRVIETKQHFLSYVAISNQKNSKFFWSFSSQLCSRSHRGYLLRANLYGQPGAMRPSVPALTLHRRARRARTQPLMPVGKELTPLPERWWCLWNGLRPERNCCFLLRNPVTTVWKTLLAFIDSFISTLSLSDSNMSL